ncbi:unnamed protein product [Rhodiola kirilowii]
MPGRLPRRSRTSTCMLLQIRFLDGAFLIMRLLQ